LGLLLMVNCKLVAYDEYFTSLRFETDLADLSIIFMRNLILYMPNLFQKVTLISVLYQRIRSAYRETSIRALGFDEESLK